MFSFIHSPLREEGTVVSTLPVCGDFASPTDRFPMMSNWSTSAPRKPPQHPRPVSRAYTAIVHLRIVIDRRSSEDLTVLVLDILLLPALPFSLVHYCDIRYIMFESPFLQEIRRRRGQRSSSGSKRPRSLLW